jgi:phytanoyl-CoA hydroxylase
MTSLTAQQWGDYRRDGYVRLGKVLSDADLAALQARIDDIMLGRARIDYSRIMMQLDSTTGAYEDAGEQSRGHKGATLNYRKIQDLEFDPLFLAYMQRPLFRDICARQYGAQTPIACFRAMFMNKPARRGTLLPWHQDRWQHLDRDPLVTLWTALDPATVANGCVQVIPGSHGSLINPDHPGGFLRPEHMTEHCPEDQAVFLELRAGEAVLLHNWLLHRSDVNRSDVARRAFSVCYMDAATRAKNGERYTTVFGPGAMEVGELEAARA